MLKEDYNGSPVKLLMHVIRFHKELGPGLLESAYEYALLTEFKLRSIAAANQVQTQLFYKGINTGKFYMMDLVIENQIVIEIKCCDVMPPVYTAQIISYLKLSHKKLDFLVNFHVPLIKDGIKRYVNNF